MVCQILAILLENQPQFRSGVVSEKKLKKTTIDEGSIPPIL